MSGPKWTLQKFKELPSVYRPDYDRQAAFFMKMGGNGYVRAAKGKEIARDEL